MSLNLRIILSATLVLLIFISLTALTLEKAFTDSAETALHDKMTSQLYALMAAAEVDKSSVVMPSSELDALLGLPSSGVYAYVVNKNGKTLWQSSSTLGAYPPEPESINKGEKQFGKTGNNRKAFYTLAYGVNWATDDNTTVALTFNISTDLESFNKQIVSFRRTLWTWLLAMAALLLVSQAIILRWGLSPMRRVQIELNQIETGKQDSIEENYPVEIKQLTDNINILLNHERDHKLRYRNALGDLAHSLKTPLAVLQSAITSKDSTSADELKEQIKRMNSIVEYQLQRASTAGTTGIGSSVNLEKAINRVIESLQKVYRDKNVEIDSNIDSSIAFKGDEGDLMEILGNLLDNAFKWCNQRVTISAEQTDKQVSLRIEDDGPGMKPEQVEQLMQRGARADEGMPGHGIGLSIVQNIVTAYHGDMQIEASQSGGLCVNIII